MLEQLRRRHTPDNAQEAPANQRKMPETGDFDFRPERAYVLLGGKPEDIQINCTACSGKFSGPCEPRCPYCGTQRKVYYADVTNTKLMSGLMSELPQKQIEEATLVLPDEKIVKVGSGSDLPLVVASEVLADTGVSIGTIVAKKLHAESGIFTGSQFGTIIILDNGQASFGYDTYIRTLITGKKVSPIVFGGFCHVGKFLSVGNPSYTSGSNFYVKEVGRLSYPDFLSRVSEILAPKE